MLSLNKSNGIETIAYLICFFYFENCATLWYDKFVGELADGTTFVNTYEPKISFHLDKSDKEKLRVKLNPQLEEILIEIPNNIGEEADIQFDNTENTNHYLPSDPRTPNRQRIRVKVSKPNHLYRSYTLHTQCVQSLTNQKYIEL
jgi:hypothetical protein